MNSETRRRGIRGARPSCFLYRCTMAVCGTPLTLSRNEANTVGLRPAGMCNNSKCVTTPGLTNRTTMALLDFSSLFLCLHIQIVFVWHPMPRLSLVTAASASAAALATSAVASATSSSPSAPRRPPYPSLHYTYNYSFPSFIPAVLPLIVITRFLTLSLT